MKSEKVIAISGSGGFIGSFLSRYFSEKGYQIIPLHRELLQPEGKKELESIIGSSDIIINLAGAPILHYWTKTYKKELMESRIHTTRMLVAAIRRAQQKPSLFISASAVGFYDHDICYDEYNARSGTGFLSKICIEWEKEAQQTASDVRTVITRFGIIFASKGGAFEKMAGTAKYKVSTIFGSGKQFFPWMALEDLAAGMAFFISHPELSGIFNFTVPELITYKDFASQIKAYYHASVIVQVPDFFIRLGLGEAASFITDTPCVRPTRLQEAGFTYKYPDLNSFLTSLSK